MINELFGLSELGSSITARELTVRHEAMVRRIGELGVGSLEQVWKCHLLK